MSNPFTLSFGKKPLQYISRISQTNEIVTTFLDKEFSNQIYMITGVRGRYARIVAGVSDTGVRIISVLNALRMLFYRPKYLKQSKEKQTQPILSSAD